MKKVLTTDNLDVIKRKIGRVENIEKLKQSNLKVGDVIEVLGYYSADDGATHKRIIANEDDGSGVQLNNGKWANIVKEQSMSLFYETYLKNTRGFIAHRGMSGVAPENTLPAYQKAYENNMLLWETDLDITKDGVWILMHDSTVDRTTNGMGAVTELTLEQIKSFDIDGGENATYYENTKVPTFEEWILLAKKLNCFPFAEIKRTDATDDEIKLLVDIIKKYNMEERFAFCSFGDKVLEKVRKFSLKIQLWWIPNNITQDSIQWCKRVGNAHLYPDDTQITKEKVLFANSQGVNIATWTVNSPDVAQKMFDKGVCLVASDWISEVY